MPTRPPPEKPEAPKTGGLPREARIRRRANFVQAQKGADFRVRAPAFLIVVTVRTDGDARIGLVATKKLGCAVERNRAKRRVRALFRAGARALPVDLIVILHADVLEAPFDALEQQWSRAMREVQSRASALWRKRSTGLAPPGN